MSWIPVSITNIICKCQGKNLKNLLKDGVLLAFQNIFHIQINCALFFFSSNQNELYQYFYLFTLRDKVWSRSAESWGFFWSRILDICTRSPCSPESTWSCNPLYSHKKFWTHIMTWLIFIKDVPIISLLLGYLHFWKGCDLLTEQFWIPFI